jgi:hypothetical protein
VTGVATVTLAAVAAKVTDVEPEGMVTDEGTLAAVGEAEIPIAAPPLGAGAVSVTVQVDPAEGLMDAGLHERLLRAAIWRMLTVAPLTVVGIEVPAELAETPLVS